MTVLFVEVFPIQPEAMPPLLAYQLTFESDVPERTHRAGARLAAWLRRSYGSGWYWLVDTLITDDIDRNPIEIVVTLDALKEDHPEIFGVIESVDMNPTSDVPAAAIVGFMQRTHFDAIGEDMQAVLDRFNERIRNAKVEREYHMRGWVVDGVPAVSFSIASRLIYNQTAGQFIAGLEDQEAVAEKLVGLWATDDERTLRGEIVQVIGKVGEHRKQLDESSMPHIDPDMLDAVPDHDWLVVVKSGRYEYEFPATLLRLIVRLPHLSRFNIDPAQAIHTLQMEPRVRSNQVRAVSDVAKNVGLISNAYNARVQDAAFVSANFEMNLRFEDNRVRPYRHETLSVDFLKCGVYKLRQPFQNAPVRVCVVNTLPMKMQDFVEALQRQLDRHFPFEIDMVRERKVRVVNRKTLESAVRVVEKENPDIILAFFADETAAGDDEDGDADATAAYMKSLTLGRGIPMHIINQTTLDNPDAMPSIIMSILGKTGSAPFVLAEPLEHADFIVGLDIVRRTFRTLQETRLTAIARVYKADGEFLHYVVRELSIEGDKLPYVLMRDLFPQKQYAGKRVVIHHQGAFEPDLLMALTGWAGAINATLYPVEIIRFGAPRLYALDHSSVVQPPWGSAFKLSDTEAVLVSSVPKENVTPQPVHIRTVSAGTHALPVEDALRGILVWTLLAYGAERQPKLPVTVLNTDQLAYWMEKGGTLNTSTGEVPFWL